MKKIKLLLLIGFTVPFSITNAQNQESYYYFGLLHLRSLIHILNENLKLSFQLFYKRFYLHQ